MKYWEIIADNLSKAGWSLGWVSTVDSQRRTIWIVDAHGYENRFIVRANEIWLRLWNWKGRFTLAANCLD